MITGCVVLFCVGFFLGYHARLGERVEEQLQEQQDYLSDLDATWGIFEASEGRERFELALKDKYRRH